jgi:hypothetical protein
MNKCTRVKGLKFKSIDIELAFKLWICGEENLEAAIQ